MIQIPSEFILNIASVIIVSYILLKIFYKAFGLNWPELYFSVNDKIALFVSVSPLRYGAFRLLPVFVAITFSLGIFMRYYDTTTNISLEL